MPTPVARSVLLSQADNKNAVLGLLSPRDFKLFSAELEPVELGFMDMVYEPHEPMRNFYFLQHGAASIVAPMENGSEIEVGMIGWEGFLGGPALLGVDRSPNRTFIQLPGKAHRIQMAAVLRLARDNDGIREALLRFVQAYSVQVSQTAACNRAHSVEERLARWLLMAHDRIPQNEHANPPVPITHELMARMLGARRSTVTIVAGILQKGNFIHYQRGLVRIIDRKGLENVACECYDSVRVEYERLLRNGHDRQP